MKISLMEEVLENMDENEIKEVLDSHKQTLNEHDNRLKNHDEKITELQIKNAGYDQRFDNIDHQFDSIKNSLTRIENNNLQSSTILLNALSTIATGNASSKNDILKEETKGETEIKKVKLHNNLTITLKILAIISLLITSIVAVKYGITIK